MDLGLGELDDDQLLELLGQACLELAQRDPIVRNLAQATVFDAAEQSKVRKEALAQAVEFARADYVHQLEKEIAAEIREGVANGRIRLISPAEEAALAVQTDLSAKVEILDQMIAAADTFDDATFRMRVVPDGGDCYIEIEETEDFNRARRNRIKVPRFQASALTYQIATYVRATLRQRDDQQPFYASPPTPLAL